MSLGVICPGQGSQHSGMFDLLAANDMARPVLAQAQAVLGTDLAKLIESDRERQRNRYAQPLLCAAALATWTALRPHLPVPRVFAGYSVGELAAYGCADAISVRGLIALACRRARHMETACTTPTEMIAVRGMSRAQLEMLCDRYDARMAIVNGADRFVVGVTRKQAGPLREAAAARGATPTTLAVEIASHTPWLAAASAGFRQDLEHSSLRDPVVPVLAGIHGMPVYTRRDAIDVLSRQIASTIDWAACMQALRECGCTVLLELGPGNALARMVHEALPDIAVRSVADFRSLNAVIDWVNKRPPG